MQVTYSGVHSILIGDFVNGVYDRSGFIHSWEDWHLIPEKPPVIVPPEIQNSSVEVPGTNGNIDMTSVLLGYPLYSNRSGTLDFYVNTSDTGWDWDIAYDTIMNAIHGFNKKIILTDMPSFFYEGRLSVNSFESDRLCYKLSIDYDLQPFKRMIWSTEDDWQWNPFDFITGVIPDKDSFEITVPANSDSEWLVFSQDIAGTMPVIPKVTATTSVEAYNNPQGEPSAFLYHNRGVTPASWEHFLSTDANSDKTVYTHVNPLITLGRPVSGYEFAIYFRNRFKNANDEFIPATFRVDFRPGRL